MKRRSRVVTTPVSYSGRVRFKSHHFPVITTDYSGPAPVSGRNYQYSVYAGHDRCVPLTSPNQIHTIRRYHPRN